MGTPAEPSPGAVAAFWARVLSPAELAELAGAGEPSCGATPPELAGSAVPVSCPFKPGHKCKCRFFGKLEGGPL
jgi:hypothetical protein